MDLGAARDHLDLAKEQWERASTAWWEPSDAATCVTNAFYAYENLIVAVAEAYDRKWEPNHYKKATLAGELYQVGILATNVGDTVLRMNNLRKDVSYGEPGDQLSNADLENIVSDLEKFIREVEVVVDIREQGAGDQ